MMDKVIITGLQPWSKEIYEEGKKETTKETTKKAKKTK